MEIAHLETTVDRCVRKEPASKETHCCPSGLPLRDEHDFSFPFVMQRGVDQRSVISGCG